MVVQVGDTIPSHLFSHVPYTSELEDSSLCGRPIKIDTNEWKGKRVVLVGVPGAFTPGCHVTHIPPFVQKAKEIKAKGSDVLAFVAINGAFVMSAWGRTVGAKDEIIFLSDANASFASQLGLSVDRSAQGLGIRTARFVLVIDDLKVKYVEVDQPGKIEATTADTLLGNWPAKA